jgi:hypothetical protein
MQGNWINNAPYYRCRFPDEYALANKINHPRNVYLREDALLPTLDRWLGTYFAPHRRAETIATIAAAHGEDGDDPAAVMARQTIIECDRKLARHRTALEALDDNTDPTLIAGWISETQQRRAAAETQLRQTARHTPMTSQQITELINDLGDTATLLATADPAGKADLYAKLGLHLTYDPAKQTVRAEARLNPHRIGRRFVSEGGLASYAHGLARRSRATSVTGIARIATSMPSHRQGFDGAARGGEEQVVLVPEASVDL